MFPARKNACNVNSKIILPEAFFNYLVFLPQYLEILNFFTLNFLFFQEICNYKHSLFVFVKITQLVDYKKQSKQIIDLCYTVLVGKYFLAGKRNFTIKL